MKNPTTGVLSRLTGAFNRTEVDAAAAPLDRSSDEWRQQFGAVRMRPADTRAVPSPPAARSSPAPAIFAAAIIIGLLTYGYWPSKHSTAAAEPAQSTSTPIQVAEAADFSGLRPLADLDPKTAPPHVIKLRTVSRLLLGSTPRGGGAAGAVGGGDYPGRRFAESRAPELRSVTRARRDTQSGGSGSASGSVATASIPSRAAHPALERQRPVISSAHPVSSHHAAAAPVHTSPAAHKAATYDETNPLGLPQ